MRENATIIARYYDALERYNTIVYDEEIEKTYSINHEKQEIYFMNELTAISDTLEELMEAKEIVYISKGIIPSLKLEIFESEWLESEKIKLFNLLLEMYYCEDRK